MLQCGLVGLPNAGKSTIFSALGAGKAEIGSFPFSTINPNIGQAVVPDKRLNRLVEIFSPQQAVPARVAFVDIAGLVKGASKGEGLGNQFLAHIREVSVIVHVVRCFQSAHDNSPVHPLEDIAMVEEELLLSDIEMVERRQEKVKKRPDIAAESKACLQRINQHLSQGHPARTLSLSDADQEVMASLQLLTAKKMLYLCNLSENPNEQEKKVVEKIAARGSAHTVCGKIEAEIAQITDAQERQFFLQELGIDRSSLDTLRAAAYDLLGLGTFFTAGPKEVRAWSFRKGITAPQAAGIIHSDFEKGFIRAEVYHYDDIIQHGSEKVLREQGKIRQEGRGYQIQDGDVIFFRWNR